MNTDSIIKQIHDAFRDTRLGEGIGFFEADCVDDHLPPEHPERQLYRAQDRLYGCRDILTWIDEKTLRTRFHPFSAFTFMDGAGRRFALPCYLIWALQDHPLAPDLEDILNDFTLSNTTLNAEQTAAVRAVIHACTPHLSTHFNHNFPK